METNFGSLDMCFQQSAMICDPFECRSRRGGGDWNRACNCAKDPPPPPPPQMNSRRRRRTKRRENWWWFKRGRAHRGSKDPLYSPGPKLSYPHQGEDLCLKHWWELIFFDLKHFKKPRMAVHWEWCSILEKLQTLTNFGIFVKFFFLVKQTS